MASVSMSGYLRDPLGEFSDKDKILFKHQTTTGTVLAGSVSVFDVDETGYYDIEVGYGNVQIMSRNRYDCRWYSHGVFTINSDTTADNLPTLLNATVPLSDSEILEVESLLQDAADYASAAEAAQTAAEAAQSATEALFDAGFDSNVATSVGLAATPYPDLHIPFNDGLRIESGYGTNDTITVDGVDYVLPSKSVDFARSTGCYYLNKSGYTTYADVDEPCITSYGLMTHPAFTNSITDSEDLSQWLWGDADTGTDGVLAPDGITEAYYVESNSSSDKIQRTVSNNGSGDYCTIQYYIKSRTSDYGKLRWISYTGGTTQDYKFIINLSTGEVVEEDNDGAVVQVQKAINGWFLVAITGQDNNTGNTSYRIDLQSCDDSGVTVAGGSVYIWGISCAVGIKGIHPYVKTAGATETVTATNTSFYVENNMPNPKSSFSMQFDAIKSIGTDAYLSSSSYVGGDYGWVIRDQGSYWLAFVADSDYYSGSNITIVSDSSVDLGAYTRIIYVYDDETKLTQLFVDGVLKADSSESYPLGATPNYLADSEQKVLIGTRPSGSAINSCIKGLKIYFSALTAEQVAALGAAE
jgi:hypothetical protein